MNDLLSIAITGKGTPEAPTDNTKTIKDCHVGSNQVVATDEEISKNNRLAIMKEIYAKRSRG